MSSPPFLPPSILARLLLFLERKLTRGGTSTSRPFGSASEDFNKFETILLVGAYVHPLRLTTDVRTLTPMFSSSSGIGITPFASILKTIWYRMNKWVFAFPGPAFPWRETDLRCGRLVPALVKRSGHDSPRSTSSGYVPCLSSGSSSDARLTAGCGSMRPRSSGTLGRQSGSTRSFMRSKSRTFRGGLKSASS